jgi:hypothetical protein
VPNVKVSVPYQILQDDALHRIQRRVAAIKAQYAGQVSNLTENWNGYVGTFSGSARGFAVSASITVSLSEVSVEMGLPVVAIGFKGQIEQALRNELTTVLAYESKGDRWAATLSRSSSQCDLAKASSTKLLPTLTCCRRQRLRARRRQKGT